MNTKKTQDQRFLDAQIALIMGAPDDELDGLLQEIGFNPNDLAARGKVAVERASAAIKQAHHTSDVLSSLPAPRQREVAKRLGIRRSVLTALAEHRALVETIPKRFLQKLAMEVGATFETITLALSGPVRFASAQHKSDQAPEPPNQVTFEQLIRDASMTESEIAELMREDI
jgi:hypothetical protein